MARLWKNVMVGLMAAVFIAVFAIVGTAPASAVVINANNEIVIDSGDQGEMFDISFFMSSADIFSTFCEGDCGGLTLASFAGITLDTSTWWTIDTITLNMNADDSIVFIVNIIDQSTGFLGGNDRVHSWGFNTTPDTDGSVVGTSNDENSNAADTIWFFSNAGANLGGFMIEDCVFTTNNCQGGGGGLLLGSSDQIQLTLTGAFFDNAGSGLLLLQPDYAIKYQTSLASQLGLDVSRICSTTVTTNCFQESMEIAGFAEFTDDEIRVPEPATLLLYGIGLLGLGVFARRRRRIAA